jgi:hypothetical protein
MDCVVKRGRRGYLFMTGDELPYPRLSRHTVESVTGDHLDDDLTAEEIVAELQKTFDPFFIIPDPGRAGRCERRWRDLLGDHVLVTEQPEDICNVAAGAVSLCEGAVPDLDALAAVLHAAGAHGEEVARAVRALRPLADGGAGPAPEKGGIGMAIKRLFVK